MATRAEVLELLERGMSYGAAADRLGIQPGLAYMIATGLPADGGDALTEEDKQRPGFVEGSTQHLSNPQPPENPTQNDTVLAWIKQRAHADASLLRTAADRNAEPGPVDDPADDKDIITVLTRDHDQVTALIEQLSAIPSHKKGGSEWQIRRRESIVDMIAKRLSRHEAAEEQHLWPRVRDELGEEWARTGLAQEQEATETLAKLGKADADSDEFDELVEELTIQCRKHVAHEEQVFLRLNDSVPEGERQKLGRKATRAKKVAPTRPHPDAPREPKGAVKAAGLPAAAADKVRDAARARPAARKGKAPAEARAKRSQAKAAEAGDPVTGDGITSSDDG